MTHTNYISPLTFQQKLAAIRNGDAAKTTGPKPKKYLNKVSPKKQAADKAAKEQLNGDDTIKEKWFQRQRRKLTGLCQCGCATRSSKHEDDHFRSSIAHVFPQRLFPSIQYNDLNWVERNFWEGHHANMDNRSMDLWPNFADWNDIKERFHQLAPLLTDEERATKFYSQLEKLVYAH